MHVKEETKDIMEHSGFIYQGYIKAGHLRRRKYLTQEEWNRFGTINEKEINGVHYYLDVQEYLCKKYDIILTCYETKREKRIRVLKKFNFKNLDKGIVVFNDCVKEFSNMLDDMFSQFGSSTINKDFIVSPRSRKSDIDKLIGKHKPVQKSFIQSKPQRVKIWSDQPKPKKRKGKKKMNRDQENLKRIWGST